MDPKIHTIIAVGAIFIAYHVGRYFAVRNAFDDIVSTTLDKLEKDGYLAVKEDKDGIKDFIPISTIIAKAMRDARTTK